MSLKLFYDSWEFDDNFRDDLETKSTLDKGSSPSDMLRLSSSFLYELLLDFLFKLQHFIYQKACRIINCTTLPIKIYNFQTGSFLKLFELSLPPSHPQYKTQYNHFDNRPAKAPSASELSDT